DSRIEGFHRAQQDAAIEVIPLIVGGCVPFGGEVLVTLGDEVASERRPHVEVRLDEARHDDHAPSVDHLGALPVKILSDGNDLPVADQDLPGFEYAHLGIHRYDDAAVDEVGGAFWTFRHGWFLQWSKRASEAH